MTREFENAIVGLRDRDTGRLVAVYPDKVTGDLGNVQKKVYDWFYKSSCSAEEAMRHCFVDDLNEHELKSSGH